MNNLKAIFHMLSNDAKQAQPRANANPRPPQEEEKNPDVQMDEINSNQINSSAAFKPPYQEQNVNAANMEMFMDPGERQRAQTYYK